ncbi:wHTH domain-containing protein [Actinomadura violacea]|nr:hypothetical protein [Actinomadura violacea]
MHLSSGTRVNDILRGRSRPVDADQLEALVRALGGGDDDVRTAARLFDRLPPAGPAVPAPHPWATLVREHVAWDSVDSRCDATAFQDAAAAVADRLGTLGRDAEAALDDDPWLDPDLGARFTKRVDWLLRAPLAGALPDLSPAEAALLALVPFLHHAHMARTLAELRDIGPLDLDSEGTDGPRREYATFLRGQRELVDRARARTLPDREAAGTEIGWWLFHRWAARYPVAYRLGAVRDLLDDTGIADPPMRDEVLSTKTVQRFLAALRLDLSELGDTGRMNAPQHETVLFAGEPHEQRVRELLIGQVLTVAYALAIDLVRLPDIVVRHLGIPHPVDPARLRRTATDRARWVLESDCLVLRADCHHPAELEGLRQYAGQVDALLHTIRQGCRGLRTMQVLTRLPARASADDVRADADDDGRALFQRVSRFRLDERRVQDLLMGEQLYQDRGLAIRELYQNALDACRYRKADLAYRSRGDWPDAWEGRIRFVQGVDANGRAYLECRDNGIGMTEAVLTDVFSQAGTRFTDTTEFLIESADWKSSDPPVPFHANSRFGIGVLSYFMIADEIEVVTRPVDRGGRHHPALKASIFGPGHLFRIEHLPADPFTGTMVRLYLRDGDDAPSCVEELRRLVGIAEFHTTAEHDAQREVWEPGVLKARVRPSWETDGLNVHGKLVPWTDPEGDGQVVWCESGGGLLVDGIHARPAVRRGVFAGLGDGTLHGAIVNLTGRRLPDRLSVDRRKVLTDVSAAAEELLRVAAGELVSGGSDLLDVRWLTDLTEASPRLGDLVSETAAASGAAFRTRTASLEAARTGCFLQDSHLVMNGDEAAHESKSKSGYWEWDFGPYVSDHVLLWRLAAHGRQAELLGEAGGDARSVLRALPSDIFLLGSNIAAIRSDRDMIPNYWDWSPDDLRHHPGHVLWVALLTGTAPREVARRAAALGVREIEPARFGESTVAVEDLALLSERQNGRPRWLDVRETVPFGHLVAIALQFGTGLRALRERIEGYGHILPEVEPSTDSPSNRDLRLLTWGAEGGPIAHRPQALPASHLIQCAHDLDISVAEVRERVAIFGFRTEALNLPDRPSSEDRALFDWWLGYSQCDEFDSRYPLPPAHLVRASFVLGVTISEVGDRLASYGVLVPTRLPEDVADMDLALLSRDGDASPPWRTAGEEISMPELLVLSARAGCEPEVAAARLADYGLVVPGGPYAARIDESVVRLLSRNLHTRGPLLDPREPVTRGHLVRAFAELGIEPRTAADLLLQCGMSLCQGAMSATADAGDILLLRYRQNFSDSWLSEDEPVPLFHLLRASRKAGITLREAAERLRWLGLDVPDVDESIAEALRRLPRAT